LHSAKDFGEVSPPRYTIVGYLVEEIAPALSTCNSVEDESPARLLLTAGDNSIHNPRAGALGGQFRSAVWAPTGICPLSVGLSVHVFPDPSSSGPRL